MADYRSWVSAKAQVVAKTTDGAEWGHGVVIGYADQPTLLIERPDGSRFSWIASLTERSEEEVIVTPDDIRALVADLDSGCNGGDLPELLNRAARTLEALAGPS